MDWARRKGKSWPGEIRSECEWDRRTVTGDRPVKALERAAAGLNKGPDFVDHEATRSRHVTACRIACRTVISQWSLPVQRTYRSAALEHVCHISCSATTLLAKSQAILFTDGC